MSDEKTEQPTDKKLEDAHRDGETAKSADLTAAAVLLSGCLLLALTASVFGERWRALLDLALDVDSSRHPVMTLKQTISYFALQLVLMTLPVGFVFALVAWIATWAQTGVVLSFKPVELKMSAINPASGLKRIFSVRSMIDLVKMIIKGVAVAAAVWKLILILMPSIVGAAYQSVMDIAEIGMTLLVRLLAAGGGLFLILGAADFGIQRWLFIRDHRMSKDEVKREHKNSEGDPHIKGERKKLARELADEAKPKQSVAGAQAVVVNPTHYAVAIRYAPEEYGLPRIIAKGVDDEALALREEAAALGIPIVGNPPLARSLYRVDLYGPVPESLFETVAEVLAWVGEMGASGTPGAEPQH
ncbi:type III secretion system export apparatus subunit SctU (plasmid) [Ralstonia solanacearum]|uniref:Flagellar type III secretion system protein FlhB n=2 Tax=Ralstonia solanacearum species complex TaxID=3116862 RepID=B7ZJF3_RALSL|nr:MULTISPECIES: type III secretion system export apparatus subunit SctU [Ralstonia]APC66491.1 EscU/YscU/HrcU family type III secretion system export apparatus switch protein [Ralstonia solanacearum OE1-1]AUS45759.1 EscU/YscU/HrcU family type III secretion system export apparatus switch protein [Ralstonia solanacearum]API77412.1 EscU/YscU/HrcU family type III secretion system export apparatus switch protein [Ralstonia pseudosolanacearum]ASL76546.1 EscU/YscU/HrcU family type III secretion system